MSDYQFQYHFQVNPVGILPPHHFPYQSWPPKFPSSSYQHHHHDYHIPSQVTSVNPGEEVAIFFVISAVLFSICGAFMGGAAANSNWLPNKWNWQDPSTPVGVLSGAVGGILLPYGFFYSNATLGAEETLRVASMGAYLGAAMINKKWSPYQGLGWNLTSPTTYFGAFEGMQTALWFIDATSSIHAFTDEASLEGAPRGAFIALSYGTGAGIAYHYVSQYHDGNNAFWEWDRVAEPGTLFAIVDGIESGTRLPVGFAEIGRDFANRTASTITGPGASSVGFHVAEETFKDVDPWSIFGAGFMAFLYASEENKTFNFAEWNWKSFSTLEAILNGIVYGKDLPEMARDVKTSFQQKSSQKSHHSSGWGWRYKQSIRRDRNESR